jgi:hypothetical protein
MMRVRRSILALSLAGAWAVALPVALLLLPHRAPAGDQRLSVPGAPLSATAVPPLAHVFDRPLFSASSGEGEAVPPDAPQLSGIVGRLGSDAVALVRSSDGATRTLAVGESIDGWRLESLAIDAALFVRAGQRARVPLPGDDADAAPADQ